MFLGDVPKRSNYALACYHQHNFVAKSAKQNVALVMPPRKEA
jgi:hypothetical protein